MGMDLTNEIYVSDMSLSTTMSKTVHETVNRVLEGKTISKTEAYELFTTGDKNLLLAAAIALRNKYKNNSITYSRKVFINLVNLCRDSCSYCTYKKEPYEKSLSLLSPAQVIAIAETGKKSRCTEALFVTGERPEQKYSEVRSWLRSNGHTSTIEFIREMSQSVLDKTGLLPHTNAGSLTKEEISLLKDTNVSLGMMLESTSEQLMEKGMPHEMAPSKNPKLRIKTLKNAGELKMPITTGLLVGIGETSEDILNSLYVIRDIHKEYGHIQEVIMQNFSPKPHTGMAKSLPCSQYYFLKSVAMARIIMPDMNIQVPPNLSPNSFGEYLDAGINDWGGISPVTIDYVNPEFAWPSIKSVKDITNARGYNLRARLPIYPEFLQRKDYVSPKLEFNIRMLSDASGLVKEDSEN
jgi:7,8-didemethyl-8-hydroxy-5-deazariboflavin synthase